MEYGKVQPTRLDVLRRDYIHRRISLDDYEWMLARLLAKGMAHEPADSVESGVEAEETKKGLSEDKTI